MKTERMIEGNTKNILYCRWVEHKDKRMIKRAVKADIWCVKAMMRFRRRIETLVGFGMLSVDEAVELHRHITKALEVLKQRKTKDIAERVANLSVQRIARKIGGKVVEEDES